MQLGELFSQCLSHMYIKIVLMKFSIKDNFYKPNHLPMVSYHDKAYM
jgi:hypothetical protein